ncbi:MAG: zinc-binding alcohol dehydrogenase family protein [Rhodospirillales bacterium]|nr:zinc-binding alcohol dehydrogenase family protein [Rhodospirillales bacterium]
MKAVAFTHSRPVTAIDALEDIELPVPVPRHHDLLVEIKAVSVNPVDTKIRQAAEPLGEPRVLGFDAAGIVRAIGPEVQNFSVGDEVFYAGVPDRPGTNAEFHLVDDRIAGHKPKTLSFAEAAALPLTALTAWEMLFERFRIPRDQPHGGTLLIVGGAGGVGSMAIQLAAQLTDMTVIATASRPDRVEWCRSLGAHHVLNHQHDLGAQILQAGLTPPGYIFCVAQIKQHFRQLVDVLAPEGSIGIIESNTGELNVSPLIRKSATLHTEYVFTRGVLHTQNMGVQHRTLEAIAHMVDNGTLKTTMTENFGPINAPNLIRAHAALEAGNAMGKLVLEGF